MIPFESLKDQKSICSLWATLIIEELIRLGVKMVCIAPGSRSTPLVAACALRSELEKVVCQDERSAAFFALGYARATNMPAAVIVTSGSALANLWPAVVEASQDRVPLLLLTADRPPELRSVGANQTIDQVKIFGSYTRFFVDMPVPDPKISLRFLLSCLDDAVHKSVHPKPGPVHVNFMFREPFEPDAKEPWDSQLLLPISDWIPSKLPLTQHFVTGSFSETSTISMVAQMISRAESGIIIAGAIRNRDAEASLLDLAMRIGWPIVPDVLSNLRFCESPVVSHYADLSLLDEKLRDHRVEVILQLGGRVVSKRLLQYIDSHQSRLHVFIDEHDDRLDPLCKVTHRIETQVVPFISGLCDVIASAAKQSTNLWLSNSQIIEHELESLEPSLSEIYIARSLQEHLNSNYFLFCSVSMPIRDLNMFGKPQSRPPRLFANRGASGIDGILSTACGVARGLAQRGVVFVGDLTFLHDTNGLSLLKNLRDPLVIVVVNNQGGGIFAMLDIHKQKEIFTPYFDAEHEADLSGLCQAHGLRHQRIRDISEWVNIVETIPQVSEHLVIEVVSDKWKNREDHEHIREMISAKFRL